MPSPLSTIVDTSNLFRKRRRPHNRFRALGDAIRCFCYIIPEFNPGLAVSVLAIPIMRYLARRKIVLADKLGSRALRADAMESITCGWLSLVVVVSLVAQAVLGTWWVDSLGPLAIVWFLGKEGCGHNFRKIQKSLTDRSPFALSCPDAAGSVSSPKIIDQAARLSHGSL
jgi:hypothetical protein